MQFKLTVSILVAVLLSSASAAPAPQEKGVTLRKRAFVCKPTDDDGSALTNGNAARGQCAYASAGLCEYFPGNGTFSSGASNCPQSLVEGDENPPPATTTRAPPPPPTTTTRAPPPPVTTTRAPPPPPPPVTTTRAPPPPPPPVTTTSSLPPPPPPSTTETLSSSTESISVVLPSTTSVLPPAPTETPFESFTTTFIVVTATPEPTDLTGAAGTNNGALAQARFGGGGLGMVVAVVAMGGWVI